MDMQWKSYIAGYLKKKKKKKKWGWLPQDLILSLLPVGLFDDIVCTVRGGVTEKKTEKIGIVSQSRDPPLPPPPTLGQPKADIFVVSKSS